eukprot:2999045-Rhodomonas_salina.1
MGNVHPPSNLADDRHRYAVIQNEGKEKTYVEIDTKGVRIHWQVAIPSPQTGAREEAAASRESTPE